MRDFYCDGILKEDYEFCKGGRKLNYYAPPEGPY